MLPSSTFKECYAPPPNCNHYADSNELALIKRSEGILRSITGSYELAETGLK